MSKVLNLRSADLEFESRFGFAPDNLVLRLRVHVVSWSAYWKEGFSIWTRLQNNWTTKYLTTSVVPKSCSHQNESQLRCLIELIDACFLQRQQQQQQNTIRYFYPFFNLSRGISYLCESYDRKHFFKHPRYSASTVHMYIPRSLIHKPQQARYAWISLNL